MSEAAKTAFVFSGGGSLGAVHVGMLEALLEAGVGADCVAGTSVGALNAAFFAAQPDAAGVRRQREAWAGLRTCDVFPPSPLRFALALTPLSNHLVSPDGLEAIVRKWVGLERLEDAALPLAVVAADLVAGAPVVLRSGPAVDALLASTAIPGIFPPRQIGGRELVDGGVVENSPLSAAIADGATRVIVLPSGNTCDLRGLQVPALAIVLQSLNVMLSRQLAVDLERYGASADVRVVPVACPLPTRPHDFSASVRLMDEARDHTRRWLDQGGLNGWA